MVVARVLRVLAEFLGDVFPDEVACAAGALTHGLELRDPPIKAVTNHDLKCEPAGDGWKIRVIIDV